MGVGDGQRPCAGSSRRRSMRSFEWTLATTTSRRSSRSVVLVEGAVLEDVDLDAGEDAERRQLGVEPARSRRAGRAGARGSSPWATVSRGEWSVSTMYSWPSADGGAGHVLDRRAAVGPRRSAGGSRPGAPRGRAGPRRRAAMTVSASRSARYSAGSRRDGVGDHRPGARADAGEVAGGVPVRTCSAIASSARGRATTSAALGKARTFGDGASDRSSR